MSGVLQCPGQVFEVFRRRAETAVNEGSGLNTKISRISNAAEIARDMDLDFDEFDDDVEFSAELSKANSQQSSGTRAALSYESDESVISEKEFRRALDRFYTQTQNENVCEADIGEYEPAESDFERLLEEIGMQRRSHKESGKISTYIGKHSKRATFLRLFEADLEDDNKTLVYLSPTVSEKGQMDTLIRAMLLTKNAQTSVFEMIMKKTEYFAKDATGDKGSSDRMALACIAQIRYLDVIYEPKLLFNSIFDRSVEEWRCTPRDTLIQALPEIISNVSLQQDAAENLRQMFLKNISDHSYAYRISILRTLTILRTDIELSDKIRAQFIRSAMSVEATVLPELVGYCLSTIQRDDKRSTFKNVLCALRANLHIDKLRLPSNPAALPDARKVASIDAILAEVFVQISKYCKYGGVKFWKQAAQVVDVRSAVEDGAVDGSDCTQGDAVDYLDEAVDRDTKELELFDVLLCFCLVDVKGGCDRLMQSAFRHQLSLLKHRLQLFEEITEKAIAFKQILNQITAHLTDVDCEATAALNVLQNLVENHVDIVLPFMVQLQEIFNLLSVFSTENVRRLFQILIVLHVANKESSTSSQYQDEFETEIERMLSSPYARENVWGVLGMLMKLQVHIRQKRTETKIISETLDGLDRATRGNSDVRAVFYSNLARLLDENPRMERSEALIDYSERLRTEFRETFFEQRGREEISSNRLEDERYTRSECCEWLKLGELVSGEGHHQLLTVENEDSGSMRKGSTIAELLSLFELLRAFAKHRRRWEGDDSQEAFFNHWNRFMFAFGVDLEAKENERRVINCDIFCYAIQWIRLMLNTFAECELTAPDEHQIIVEIMRKKFALMVECQKSLIYTIKKVGEYALPHLATNAGHKIIVHGDGAQILRKQTTGDKRAQEIIVSDESIPNNNIGDEDGEKDDANKENREESVAANNNNNNNKEEGNKNSRKRKLNRGSVDVSRVLSYFSPFRLVSIVKLIQKSLLKAKTNVRFLQLIPRKRKQTTFLVEILQKIIDIELPVKEKKLASWMTVCSICIFAFMSNCEIPIGERAVDHGDMKRVWRLLIDVIPTLCEVLDGAVQYFRSFANDTNGDDVLDDKTKREYFNQMSALLCATLTVFRQLFKCKELSTIELDERTNRVRYERRKSVMVQIEKTLIRLNVLQEDVANEDAEASVSNYLMEISSHIPTLQCAVVLSELFTSIQSSTEHQRLSMARIALSFLRKEWTDEDGNMLKGVELHKPIGTLLFLYICLRRESKRLLAVQWIIANKLAELIPDDEKRRSKINSLEECIDDELTNDEQSAHFASFTRGSFASLYKVLFGSVNETIKVLRMNNIERSGMNLDGCLLQWKCAASCFCLLSLMIRVKDLRNSSVLLCAAREGRVFLQNFSSKGSFLHLLNAERRFAKYAAGANSVMKTVQIGNRSLQNICVYAKTSKCIALLKLLPELRAASEMFIRAVHSVMVGVECDDAFQIGLLKSRNLDVMTIDDGEDDTDGDEESAGGDVVDGGETVTDSEVGDRRETARESGSEIGDLEEGEGDGVNDEQVRFLFVHS
ncbi:unnamed protein product [Anisakis simplex]|uniref:Fanconi anemia group D2 protein n=1 Tax=Anisakis simplex TaxID=6269 RepID=A0A158PNH0_ANISI|nr:unnamed protein product [Anisakis simplex]